MMVDGQLPAGDVGRAYLLLRSLSNDQDGMSFDEDEYAQTLMDSAGDREELLRGLGTLTDVFMSLFLPGGAMDLTGGGEPDDKDAAPRDAVHLIVPTIVAKLTRTTWLPQQAIPTMAGALTAAALGRSCYQWRTACGPWHTWEFVPWTYTPLFLANLIDFSRNEPGFALDMLEQILLRDKQPD